MDSMSTRMLGGFIDFIEEIGCRLEDTEKEFLLEEIDGVFIPFRFRVFDILSPVIDVHKIRDVPRGTELGPVILKRLNQEERTLNPEVLDQPFIQELVQIDVPCGFEFTGEGDPLHYRLLCA